jgi:hypothetical protein
LKRPGIERSRYREALESLRNPPPNLGEKRNLIL